MSLYELRWAVPSVPSSWMCLGGWEAASWSKWVHLGRKPGAALPAHTPSRQRAHSRSVPWGHGQAEDQLHPHHPLSRVVHKYRFHPHLLSLCLAVSKELCSIRYGLS